MPTHTHHDHHFPDDLISDDTRYKNYHNILMSWGFMYVNLGNTENKNSIQYRHWKEFIDNYHEIISSCKMKPNNCAHLAIFGVNLLQNDNYKKALMLLERSNNISPNSVVQSAIADALILSGRYRTAQRLLEHLVQTVKWKDILQYLHSCCIEPYTKDLNATAFELLTFCYLNRLNNNITLKYIAKAKQCLVTTFNIFEECNDETMAKIAEHHKTIICQLVRVSYWNNQYEEAYQYVQKLFNLCQTYSLLLDAHDNRLCFLLLGRVEGYDVFWKRSSQLLDNLTKSKSSITALEFNELQILHGAFIILHAIYANQRGDEHKHIIEDLIEDLILYRNNCCINHKKIHPLNTAIAAYYSDIGEYQLANKYFAEAAIMLIDNFDDIQNKCVCGHTKYYPLCLNLWLLFYLYSK
eukprot:430997_1